MYVLYWPLSCMNDAVPKIHLGCQSNWYYHVKFVILTAVFSIFPIAVQKTHTWYSIGKSNINGILADSDRCALLITDIFVKNSVTYKRVVKGNAYVTGNPGSGIKENNKNKQVNIAEHAADYKINLKRDFFCLWKMRFIDCDPIIHALPFVLLNSTMY